MTENQISPRALPGVIDHHCASSNGHMELVRARWAELGTPAGQDKLQARAESIRSACNEEAFTRLLRAGAAASTTHKRVAWLHRAANLVSEAADQAAVTPCRRGCSHCCHIPVTISRPEAVYIASVTSRAMAPSPEGSLSMADPDAELSIGKSAEQGPWRHHIGRACPFLVDSQCSIYDARPMACRYHLSLDSDSLLCELVTDGEPISTPSLNTLSFQAAGLAILGPSHDFADIRDWFPGAKSNS